MKFTSVNSLFFILFLGLRFTATAVPVPQDTPVSVPQYIHEPIPQDTAALGPFEDSSTGLGTEEKRGALGVGSLVRQVVSGIARIIVGQVQQDNLDRGQFTQEVVRQLHAQDPTKNYVIIHTDHEANWEGERGKDWDHSHQEFDIKIGGTMGYEIYAAHKGVFKLKGDGGFRNWAFYGRAKRVADREYHFS